MFTIKAAISDGQTKTLMDDGHTRLGWFPSFDYGTVFYLAESCCTLIGGWPTPLKNIEKYEFVSWDYEIPNINIYIYGKIIQMLYFMKFPISGKS